ncbi:hypothetical protein L208DRAFT_730687 [Tricholoma matsutake]|nr:hypothetical protein L208DRAFT_730687 [Tricholoma matsutake 945]
MSSICVPTPPCLVPSTVSTGRPVQGLALPQEKVPNSKSAMVTQGNRQPPVPIITKPRISPFLEKLDYLACSEVMSYYHFKKCA